MSIETIAAIIFLLILTVFLVQNRKKIELQKIFWPILYFALYKTKLGIKQMNSISKKHPRLTRILSVAGIWIGILGMVGIMWLLIENIFNILFVPHTAAGVALVLPFQVKGGFYVPFLYWIISIFVIATIHEFSHGVVARLHNIKIKSSGFAFLVAIIPVIPAAFVEPDEKQLAKKKRTQKLAVYAAGPFSNILTGFIFLGIFLLLSYPVATNIIDLNGAIVEGFSGNSSSQLAGIPLNSIITQIGNTTITQIDNITNSLNGEKVNDTIKIVTTNGTYFVKLGQNPSNSSLPYLGVLISQSEKNNPVFSKKYGELTASFIIWIMGLLYWLYALSLGIGLFNLVPIGPIDGGQMSREIFRKFIKDEKKAISAWNWTSLFFLAIIIFTLFSGFL